MSRPGILNRLERGIYSSHTSEGVMLQVVPETIAIPLAVLSLTLNVMFNCSLFKVMPVAATVVKKQMNVLCNNNWEINGSLAKHC